MTGNWEDGYTFEYYSYSLDVLDYYRNKREYELDELEEDFEERRAGQATAGQATPAGKRQITRAVTRTSAESPVI